MKNRIKHSLVTFQLLFISTVLFAQAESNAASPLQKAREYLDSIGSLQHSKEWPEVNPAYFMQNLRRNIEKPLLIYAGRNTNFCSYAAITYTLLKEEPLRYCHFMIDLYTKGKALYRKQLLQPSRAVKEEAGKILYEGELDRNHADQIWFLTMADHYKGYINWFNQKYKPGDENRLWAATNLAKFNRMLHKLTGRNIRSRGSDLIRPSFSNLTKTLVTDLQKGDVYIYLNNTMLRKKNHNKIKKRIPTHYVVLLNVAKENSELTITYWDAGFKTLRKVPLKTMKKIIYGISVCEK